MSPFCILAIQIGVWYYLIVDLFSLKATYVEHVFRYSFVIRVSFLIGLFVFLLFSFGSSSCILDTSPLSGLQFCPLTLLKLLSLKSPLNFEIPNPYILTSFHHICPVCIIWPLWSSRIFSSHWSPWSYTHHTAFWPLLFKDLHFLVLFSMHLLNITVSQSLVPRLLVCFSVFRLFLVDWIHSYGSNYHLLC